MKFHIIMNVNKDKPDIAPSFALLLLVRLRPGLFLSLLPFSRLQTDAPHWAIPRLSSIFYAKQYSWSRFTDFTVDCIYVTILYWP